jgi:putative phosphoserine phosphatase/1-acylglycerol-3-phosphate O-acyltransferase
MEKQTKSYIAFFDLDKTILSCNSGTYLVRQAYTTGVMSTGNLINAIIHGLLYKYNLRDTNLIISRMASWVKGLSNEIITDLSRKVVDRHLIDYVRPEIIKEFEVHKKNNAGLAILSSATSSICEPMSNYLGMDTSVCTILEVIDGILTGFPEGKFCFGDEKRIRLLSYCEKNNYDPANAWYYADSITDLHAFEVVGHPVCVYPDKKLSVIARERGWRVIE